MIEAMAARFEFEKFDGSNFSIWKLKIKALLRKENCLAAIDGRPAELTDKAWNDMDGNAMANFHLTLGDNVLSSIEEKKTAKEIWDHLTKLYEGKSLHNKIFLKRKLYTLRMMESTSMTEHLNILNTLFSQLTSLGYKVNQEERAEILLQSLPDSYDQLVINLTNNILTDYLVFDEIAAAVIQEENRRKSREDYSRGDIMAMTRERSSNFNPSGSHGRGKKKGIKCYHCGRIGHMKKDCRELKNSNSQENVINIFDDDDDAV